jgi:hypothetical protein
MSKPYVPSPALRELAKKFLEDQNKGIATPAEKAQTAMRTKRTNLVELSSLAAPEPIRTATRALRALVDAWNTASEKERRQFILSFPDV